MSDPGPSQIFVSLVAFSEADPLPAYVSLFLFFKIIAVVVWDMPGGQAITTDFLPLPSLTNFHFVSRSIT